MGPCSSGDKSIKISYDIQEEDKELDSKESFAGSTLAKLVS